jgi:hypothetical protein
MSNFWIVPGTTDCGKEPGDYELWEGDHTIQQFIQVDDPIILAAIWRLQF